MTYYFDKKHAELAAIGLSKVEGHEALRTFDEKIVWDVTLAAESPGMPEDLRDQIHRTVLKYSIACQPLLSDLSTRVGPDPQDGENHRRILNDLVWNLHTIFHEVAGRRIDWFSDSPESPLRVLAARGDEYREKLATEEVRRP